MNTFSLPSEEFARFVFSPNIGVLTSEDVAKFLPDDNREFTNLLLPFSSDIKEGISFKFTMCFSLFKRWK